MNLPLHRTKSIRPGNFAAYYAYGLPVQDSKVSITTPYLYGGKEFYSLKGINLYDFNARTYAPDLARFMQPDPLATENHGVSSYIFCNGDPINFVDPTGEKVYYVDMAGRLVASDEILGKIANRSEYEASLEGLDRVVIIDQDGKIIRESDTFKEGTITIHDNNQSELKGKDITLFEITGENAGKSVFETLSRAITARNGIEFGYIRKGTRENGSNFVFTDHNVATVENMGNVFYYSAKVNNQRFKEITHSHSREPYPSKPDIGMRKSINKLFDNQNKARPKYLIYVSDVPLYIDFSD